MLSPPPSLSVFPWRKDVDNSSTDWRVASYWHLYSLSIGVFAFLIVCIFTSLRLFGLGGAVEYHKLLNAGEGEVDSIAGAHGQ